MLEKNRLQLQCRLLNDVSFFHCNDSCHYVHATTTATGKCMRCNVFDTVKINPSGGRMLCLGCEFRCAASISQLQLQLESYSQLYLQLQLSLQQSKPVINEPVINYCLVCGSKNIKIINSNRYGNDGLNLDGAQAQRRIIMCFKCNYDCVILHQQSSHQQSSQQQLSQQSKPVINKPMTGVCLACGSTNVNIIKAHYKDGSQGIICSMCKSECVILGSMQGCDQNNQPLEQKSKEDTKYDPITGFCHWCNNIVTISYIGNIPTPRYIYDKGIRFAPNCSVCHYEYVKVNEKSNNEK